MPTAVGPNTFGEENLVFGYDTGDTVNSYKGEPATNLITSGLPGYFGSGGETLYQERLYGLKSDSGVFQRNFVTNPATSDTSTFNNNGGLYKNFTTSTLNSATRYVQISFDFYLVTRYRTFSSSVRGLNGYLGITNTDSTTDIYFWDTRYSNGSGDDWSNKAEYEGKWQKVSLIAALRGDKDPASINAMYIYYDKFTQGEGIFTNFVMTETTTLPTSPVRYTAGTRSATQGLVDLAGNSTIDLTNVSFDSNAQMTFDGTNDLITLADAAHLKFSNGSFTVEQVLTVNSISSKQRTFSKGSSGWSRGWHAAIRPTQWEFELSDGVSSPGNSFLISTATTVGTNHVMWVVENGATVKLYVNGTQVGSTQTITEGINFATTTSTVGIGAFESGGEYFNGKIPYTKLYSRALTASEIRSNFNAIKGRFGI